MASPAKGSVVLAPLACGGGGNSFEELIGLAVQEHVREVKTSERQMAALREENARLTAQLKGLQHARKSEPDQALKELPGAMPTSPPQTKGDFFTPVLPGPSNCDKADKDYGRPPPKAVPTTFDSPRRLRSESSDQHSVHSAEGGDMAVRSRTTSMVGPGRATVLHQGGLAFPVKDDWEITECGTELDFNKVKTLESMDDKGRSRTNVSVLVAGEKHWYISHPTSPLRLMWDVAGAVLILFDLFKLPMEAFSPPDNAFTIFMDWFTLIFWTLNIPASLTVGYNEGGLLVLSPRRIAEKYLRTWFVLDLLVVVPDWVFTIFALTQGGPGGGGGESVKLLRVLRLLRMVRLLRLLKLRQMFETFNDLVNSEYTSVIANIVQMIMALLVINHLICCVWFSISNGWKGEDTWLKFHEFQGDDWFYLYTTAFHWSITQFTPASMHVQPQNVLERSFAVVVVIFALVGFSYIVGSITGSLATLRSMNAEESQLFWDLRRYLQKNKVPKALSHRIQKYLEHMWQGTKESKPVKEVRLIQLLSEELHSELKFELAVHHLKVHPFLLEMCNVSSVTVHRLANFALAHKMLAEGDTLFHPGEVATHMYIVVKGRYWYKKINANGGPPHCEQVDKGEDWIAEPALWTKFWSHCGLLTALEHADNVTINSQKFCEQVRLNPQAQLFACGYASNFLDWLNSVPTEGLSDIYQGEEVTELHKSFFPEVFRQPTKTRRFSFSKPERIGSRLFAGTNG